MDSKITITDGNIVVVETESIDKLSIDDYWSKVVNQIPSKYFNPNLRCEGFRLYLAREAARRDSVRYLEVGVRRGHTLALVTLCASNRLDYATGIDLWVESYGGEDNPGAEWISNNIETLHDTSIVDSRVIIVTGDSHEELPILLNKRASYNLILVDGDHTPDGARQDLDDSFKLLEPGGTLVFDDAIYKGNSTLLQVWNKFISDSGISKHCDIYDEIAWCWLIK